MHQLVIQHNHIHHTLKEQESSLQKKKKAVSQYQARLDDMLRKPLSETERFEYSRLTSQVEELQYNIASNQTKVKFLEEEIKNVEKTGLSAKDRSFSKNQKKVQVVFHVQDERGVLRSFTRHLIFQNGSWVGFHPLTNRIFAFSL